MSPLIHSTHLHFHTVSLKMKMLYHKTFLASPLLFLVFILLTLSVHAKALSNEDVTAGVGPVVARDQRRTLIVTEYGDISAIDIRNGHRAPYHLQFFTLEPNSLFLPVILHEDMVFYVQTGSGRLTYIEEDDVNNVSIRRGDLVRLRGGSVFYIQSSLETERTKLRIYAIFGNAEDNTYDPSIGAYSSISELVRRFDKKIMQQALQVPDEMIEAITNRTESPTIVHAVSKMETTFWELEKWFLKRFAGMEGGLPINRKKRKTYNIFDNDPDFKNCNGWSLAVTRKHLKSLKGTNIGFFMVNLTAGSMMGPHWNPTATEITMVLEGDAMVRVVCGNSNIDKPKCQNMRFKVTPGDVFVVPRFRPMAQISYNNESLVFIGFSTSVRNNHPQFLAGKRSVIQTLDKGVLAASFNATNTTIDRLLASQADSFILGCVSCAEEEERIMNEEIKKKKKEEEEEARKREEERRKEEEEARKREEERKKEEEEARRRQEEEEARQRAEEEARRRQEEEEARQRAEEEARRRQEEEEARQRAEEEARRRQEEEEARQRAEEEARRRQEEEEARQRAEEEARRRQEEEEARQRAEEEARRRQEEEEARQRAEEEARRRQEEEEARQRAEEEARRRQEEEEARQRAEEEARRRQEEEEARQRAEEEARRRQEEEEARQRAEEEARRRQEEEIRRRQEEEARQREEARRWQEEEIRRRQEKKARQKEEEETRMKQEKEAKQREEEIRRRQEEEARRKQVEKARQREEEIRWQKEEEARAQAEQERRRQEQSGGGGGQWGRGRGEGWGGEAWGDEGGEEEMRERKEPRNENTFL